MKKRFGFLVFVLLFLLVAIIVGVRVFVPFETSVSPEPVSVTENPVESNEPSPVAVASGGAYLPTPNVDFEPVDESTFQELEITNELIVELGETEAIGGLN